MTDTFHCGGLDLTSIHGKPARWRKEGNLRTCDMCGGINRDDLARLLREGAAVEPSTKSYKSYVRGHADLAAVRGAAKHYHWHDDDPKDAIAEVWGKLVRCQNRYLLALPEFADDYPDPHREGTWKPPTAAEAAATANALAEDARRE